MIKDSTGRKLEILKELKKLNKAAYLIMMAPYTTFKIKYGMLQKTYEWKKAKILLKEYFTLEGPLQCAMCGRMLSNHFTVNHKEYNPSQIFTPDFVEILDNRCHGRYHNKHR